MNINKPLKLLVTKRLYSLAYERIYFNPSHKFSKPSKLVNMIPYVGIL